MLSHMQIETNSRDNGRLAADTSDPKGGTQRVLYITKHIN